MNRGVVAEADGEVHETSHALEREHCLRQNRSAEQQCERQTHRRNDGDEGVLERMVVEHYAFSDAACACCLDEVRAHRLDDVYTGDPDEEAGEDDAQREGGEDQVRHGIDEAAEVAGKEGVNRVQPGYRRREGETRGIAACHG